MCSGDDEWWSGVKSPGKASYSVLSVFFPNINLPDNSTSIGWSKEAIYKRCRCRHDAMRASQVGSAHIFVFIYISVNVKYIFNFSTYLYILKYILRNFELYLCMPGLRYAGWASVRDWLGWLGKWDQRGSTLRSVLLKPPTSQHPLSKGVLEWACQLDQWLSNPFSTRAVNDEFKIGHLKKTENPIKLFSE